MSAIDATQKKLKKLLYSKNLAIQSEITNLGLTVSEVVGIVGEDDPVPPEKRAEADEEAVLRKKLASDGLNEQEIEEALTGKVSEKPVVDPRFEVYLGIKKRVGIVAAQQRMKQDGFTDEEISICTGEPFTSSSRSAPAGGGKISFNFGAKKTPETTSKFHWLTLPEQDVPNTIWDKLPSYKLEKAEENRIEKWFPPAPSGKARPKAKDTAVAGPATKVSFLKPEVAQTIEIVLARYKLSVEAICKIISDLDSEVLTLTLTESLLSILPKTTDLPEGKRIEDLMVFPNPDQLNTASRFLYELMQMGQRSCAIPELQKHIAGRIKSLTSIVSTSRNKKVVTTWYIVGQIEDRLKVHKIILQWEDTKSLIEKGHFSQLETGIALVERHRPSLAKLFSIVLAVGNYLNLNATAIRTDYKPALGLKLETLPKLSMFKVTPSAVSKELSSETNLVYFLVDLILQKVSSTSSAEESAASSAVTEELLLAFEKDEYDQLPRLLSYQTVFTDVLALRGEYESLLTDFLSLTSGKRLPIIPELLFPAVSKNENDEETEESKEAKEVNTAAAAAEARAAAAKEFETLPINELIERDPLYFKIRSFEYNELDILDKIRHNFINIHEKINKLLTDFGEASIKITFDRSESINYAQFLNGKDGESNREDKVRMIFQNLYDFIDKLKSVYLFFLAKAKKQAVAEKKKADSLARQEQLKKAAKTVQIAHIATTISSDTASAQGSETDAATISAALPLPAPAPILTSVMKENTIAEVKTEEVKPIITEVKGPEVTITETKNIEKAEL